MHGHKTIALFRYLHPIDSALDPHGPLSNAVPRGVIEEVDQELNKVETRPKIQSQYLSFTTEEKTKVAKYGRSKRLIGRFRPSSELCMTMEQ